MGWGGSWSEGNGRGEGMSRAEEMGSARVSAIRQVLVSMGFSGAAIEGAVAALDGDGLVPVYRAMSVCRVSRNTIKATARKHGIVLLQRGGRLGGLVFLPGVKAAINGERVIPRGDGTFADGNGRKIGRNGGVE